MKLSSSEYEFYKINNSINKITNSKLRRGEGKAVKLRGENMRKMGGLLEVRRINGIKEVGDERREVSR